MKMIKDKQIVVGADFAGLAVKDAVVKNLEAKGWTVLDLGVKANDKDSEEMFHRIGLKVGAQISERNYERALIFCGTGMGIHVAASKCPHVHAAVCESIESAKRCIAGNNCNVLAIGGFYIGAERAIDMVNAYLETEFCEGYDDWEGFDEYHKIAYDELETFDYEQYKANNFEVVNKKDCYIGPKPIK